MSSGFTPPKFRYMEPEPCIGMGMWYPNVFTQIRLENLMIDMGFYKNKEKTKIIFVEMTENEPSGQNVSESAVQNVDEQAVKVLEKLIIDEEKENGYSGDTEEEAESVATVQAPRGELVFDGVRYDENIRTRLLNHIEIIDALDNLDAKPPELDDFFFIGPLRFHHDRISCHSTDKEINELVEDLSDFVDDRLDGFYKGDELTPVKTTNRFVLKFMKDLLNAHQNKVVISELLHLVRGNDEMEEEAYDELETTFLRAITGIIEMQF